MSALPPEPNSIRSVSLAVRRGAVEVQKSTNGGCRLPSFGLVFREPGASDVAACVESGARGIERGRCISAAAPCHVGHVQAGHCIIGARRCKTSSCRCRSAVIVDALALANGNGLRLVIPTQIGAARLNGQPLG